MDMKNEKCIKCGKKATIDYADSFLDANHGFIQPYCRFCYMKKQIKFIKGILESLEGGLKELENGISRNN